VLVLEYLRLDLDLLDRRAVLEQGLEQNLFRREQGSQAVNFLRQMLQNFQTPTNTGQALYLQVHPSIADNLLWRQELQGWDFRRQTKGSRPSHYLPIELSHEKLTLSQSRQMARGCRSSMALYIIGWAVNAFYC
jgi:hypothetical protein